MDNKDSENMSSIDIFMNMYDSVFKITEVTFIPNNDNVNSFKIVVNGIRNGKEVQIVVHKAKISIDIMHILNYGTNKEIFSFTEFE